MDSTCVDGVPSVVAVPAVDIPSGEKQASSRGQLRHHRVRSNNDHHRSPTDSDSNERTSPQSKTEPSPGGHQHHQHNNSGSGSSVFGNGFRISALSKTTNQTVPATTAAAAFSTGSSLTAGSVNVVSRQIGKLKRFLSTILSFGREIDGSTGETVKNIVFSLLCNRITIEQFQTKLQQATHFPLKTFVTPFIKATLPLLQQELLLCSQLVHQTPESFLAHNKDYLSVTAGNSGSGQHDIAARLVLSSLYNSTDQQQQQQQQQQCPPLPAAPDHSEQPPPLSMFYQSVLDECQTLFSAAGGAGTVSTAAPRRATNNKGSLKRALSVKIDPEPPPITTSAVPVITSSSSLAGCLTSELGKKAPPLPPMSSSLTPPTSASWKPALVSVSSLFDRLEHPLLLPHPATSQQQQQQQQQQQSLVNSFLESFSGSSRLLAPAAAPTVSGSTATSSSTFADKLHKQWDQLLSHISNFQTPMPTRSNTSQLLSTEYEAISTIDEIIKSQEDHSRSMLQLLRSAQDGIRRVRDEAKLTEMLHCAPASNSIDLAAIKRRSAKYYEEAVQEVQRVAQMELRRTVRSLQERTMELVEQERVRFQMMLEEVRRQSREEYSSLLTRQEDGPENCQNCGRRATEACSGCQVTRYCGRFCQQRDWFRHKPHCDHRIPLPLLKTTPPKRPKLETAATTTMENFSNSSADSPSDQNDPENLCVRQTSAPVASTTTIESGYRYESPSRSHRPSDHAPSPEDNKDSGLVSGNGALSPTVDL